MEAVGGMPSNYLPLSHADNDPPMKKKMLHLENVNLGIIGERCTSRWKGGISFQMPPLEPCHRNKFLSCKKKKKEKTFATRLFLCFHNRWRGLRLYCNCGSRKLVRPQMKSTAFLHKWAWVIVNSRTSDRTRFCLKKLYWLKIKLINRFLFIYF